MERLSIPDLNSAQVAFKEGELSAVVQITKGVEGDDFLNLKVRVWEINTDGTKRADRSGNPIECPAKVESISLSALAEGQVTLENEMARMRSEAFQRMCRFTVCHQARAALIADPDDIAVAEGGTE